MAVWRCRQAREKQTIYFWVVASKRTSENSIGEMSARARGGGIKNKRKNNKMTKRPKKKTDRDRMESFEWLDLNSRRMNDIPFAQKKKKMFLFLIENFTNGLFLRCKNELRVSPKLNGPWKSCDSLIVNFAIFYSTFIADDDRRVMTRCANEMLHNCRMPAD